MKQLSRSTVAPLNVSIALVAVLAAMSWQSARAANGTDTWTGATSSTWGTTGNWNGANNPPISGDGLVFGAASSTGTALTNNLTATDSFNGITFSSLASAYTISGNGFTLSNGITNNGSSLETFTDTVTLSKSLTFTTSAGGGGLSFTGPITGSFGLVTTGMGTISLSGQNTYTGGTTIQQGSVLLDYTQASSPSSEVLSSSGAVTLGWNAIGSNGGGGGTLSIAGGSGTNRQDFAGGTFDYIGANTLNFSSTGSLTVNLGKINRGSSTIGDGGTMNILLPSTGVSVTTTSPNLLFFGNNTNLIGPGITVNGNTWATSGATQTTGVTVTSGVFTAAATIANGTGVTFATDPSGSSNLNTSSMYYVINATTSSGTTTFQLSTAPTGGTAIAAGNGTAGTIDVAGAVSGLTSYDTSYSTGTSSISNFDVQSSGTFTTTGTSTSYSPNTIRFNQAANDTASFLNTSSQNSIADGILVTSSVGTFTSTISGGLIAGTGRRDLAVIQNDTTGTLVIGSTIISSGYDGSGVYPSIGDFTKSGAGTVLLTATNAYMGQNYFNQGTTIVTGGFVAGQALTGVLNGTGTITGLSSTAGLFVGESATVASGGPSSSSSSWYITSIGSNFVVMASSASGTGTATINFAGGGGLGNPGVNTGTLVSYDEIAPGATLQLGNGGSTGALAPAQVISDDGSFVFDRSDNGQIFSNTIIGTGSVTQMGSGVTTLTSTTNSYTGGTYITAGTLLLENTGTTSAVTTGTLGAVGSGVVTISGVSSSNYGTLAGGVGAAQSATLANPNSASLSWYLPFTNAGSAFVSNVAGNVVVNANGHLAPGTGTPGAGAVGTIYIGGNLTLNSGANVDFNFNNTANSFAAVAGTISIAGVTTINLYQEGTSNAFATAGTYDLLNFGALSGSLSNLNVGDKVAGLTYTFLDDTADSIIELQIAPNATTGTYTLTTSVGSSILHVGASTTATTTLANTGTNTADSLNYSGLGANGSGGTVTGTTTSGGPVAQGGSASNGQTFTATSTGSQTVTGTVTSVTGANGTGTATQAGNTGANVFVYSGTGTWNTAGGGTWGTTQTTNQAATNWQIKGGTPGITAGFTTTDSASFGDTGFTGTATVTLGAASPYLNAITFNDSQGSYDIEQGSGGTGIVHLDSTSTATVTVAAGNHSIGAPIELDSAAATTVASSDTLTLSGNISQSGPQTFTVNGPGTTILSGSNSFSGGTTAASGTLLLSNSAGSATGTGAFTVNGGATVGGYGTSSGPRFSVSGSGTLTNQRANLLVGMNSLTDTNTNQTLTLLGTGTSTIANANLAFNLNAKQAGAYGSNPAGSGTELNVGSTAISFGTGQGSVQFTLNLQNEPAIVGAYTPYVLIAGTLPTGGGGVDGSQYSGLTLGNVLVNSGGITETVISGNNLQLAFGSQIDEQYYGNNSYLVLYQNTNSGIDDIDVVVVPEPGTWAMMLGGLAGLLLWQRRRSKA